jgi:hypothetical protein
MIATRALRHQRVRTLVTGARGGSGGVALDYARIRYRDVGDLVRDWARAGFHVEDGHRVVVGSMTFDLASEPTSRRQREIVTTRNTVDLLKFQNLPDHVQRLHGAIDVERSEVTSERSTPRHRRPGHPNGVRRVDHVVIRTNEIDQVEAFMSEEMNLTLRRRLESDRGTMLFFREKDFPEAPFIEVVGEVRQTENDPPSTFVWGVSFVSDDLHHTRDVLGHENVSEIRSAVQPGRNICTVKIDLGTNVAIMTPHVARRARM